MMEISEKDRVAIEKLMESTPVPVTFEQMARWYFGHVSPLIFQEEEE